jgi:hypothetical protein
MLVQFIKDGTLANLEDTLAREFIRAGIVRRARRKADPEGADSPVLGEVEDRGAPVAEVVPYVSEENF